MRGSSQPPSAANREAAASRRDGAAANRQGQRTKEQYPAARGSRKKEQYPAARGSRKKEQHPAARGSRKKGSSQPPGAAVRRAAANRQGPQIEGQPPAAGTGKQPAARGGRSRNSSEGSNHQIFLAVSLAPERVSFFFCTIVRALK